MQIYSIIYTSTASHALSQNELDHLLSTARERNLRESITGVLLYVDGRFMQYLEGPSEGLKVVLEHIQASTLHRDLNMHQMHAIQTREYSAWSMAYVTSSEAAVGLSVSNASLTEFLLQESSNPVLYSDSSKRL
jgi:hypothetical protein